MTKLDVRTLNTIAAILAVTNMGQPMPQARDIKRLKEGNQPTLSSAVMCLAQQYMETDEHQRMFETEARSFLRDLRKMPLKARKWWPHAFKAYEEA